MNGDNNSSSFLTENCIPLSHKEERFETSEELEKLKNEMEQVQVKISL